jgi:hypothetical protein
MSDEDAAINDNEQGRIKRGPEPTHQAPGYSALAIDQDLGNEIVRALRKLPHEEVDTLIRRVTTAPVVRINTPQ